MKREIHKTAAALSLTAIACVSCTHPEDAGTPVPISASEERSFQSPPAGSSTAAGADSAPAKDLETLRKTIREIAAQMDETVVDGWFYGQDPRMFKSFYRRVPAEQKADFALAYHDWIGMQKQDMVADFKSYVPYSKRADFAFDWWGKHEARFNTQEMKQRVLWAHESIQDAGELWWRASEKLGRIPANSALMLAHDEEQKMLAHYTEKEGNPGSLSDQVWKRTHTK